MISPAYVLDLYAGSGAVGLEALSRGAAHVLLVEQDARAAQVVRDNARGLGLPGAAVLTGRVEHLTSGPPTAGALTKVARAPYHVAFLDPPYDVAQPTIRLVLAALREHAWLIPGAIAVVERATRGGELTWPPGWLAERSRRYGEATL